MDRKRVKLCAWEGATMERLSREELERREDELLGPLATRAADSRGRLRPEVPDPLRTCFQRDRDRILHCKSFRRMAHKTQVFLAPEGDHYRTRLTHTLEVCQISRDVARSCRLNEDLTEAIALGHDLGHTPFGHTGEDALARAMARYRGMDPATDQGRALFRHNEQSVRVVELVEKDGQGLNLCLEVVDGILCHTGPKEADTSEGQVVSICDRVAYVNHDIDDAIRAGLLSETDLPAAPCSLLGHSSTERITSMVTDLVDTTCEVGRVRMSDVTWDAMEELRAYLYAHIYSKSDAKHEEPKANRLVEELFDYYIEHLDQVPSEYRRHDADHPDVQVADFISCMTDRYAVRTYEELKVPHAWGSVTTF
jgi:dGTPase